MTRAFHPSRLPGFLPVSPSIVFDLCRSKGRRRKPIRCGPHRVVNELRRLSALSNRHFTRHSAFLSPSPLHLEYICRPFLFASGCPSGPLQIGSAIFPPLACSLHMLPHHRGRKLPRKQRGTPTTAARSSPTARSPARHNQFRSIDRRRREEGREEGGPRSCEQNMARLSSHARLSIPPPHFRVSRFVRPSG